MHKGLGKVTHEEGSPPYIESPSVTEHPQLWHYRNWADWMAADSWTDLKENHTPIPDDIL
jgi:hypothetical protein